MDIWRVIERNVEKTNPYGRFLTLTYTINQQTVKVRTLCSFLLLDNLDDSEKKYVDQMLEQAAEDDEERNSDWTKVISALVRRWRDKDDTIEIPRVEELIKSIGHTEGSFALSTLNPEQRSEHCLFLDREPKENHAELPFEVDQTFVKKVEEKRAKIRARKPKSSIVQEFKNRNMDGKSRSQVITTSGKSTVVPSKKTEKRAKKSRSHVLKSAKRPRSKALPFMSQKVKSVKIFEEMSVDKEDGETKKKKKKRRGAGIATVGAMLKQKKKEKELEKKKERKMKEKKRKRDERQRKKEEAKRRKLEKKQSKGKRHVEKNETVETKPAPPTKKPAPPTKKPAPPTKKPAPPTKKPKTKPTSSDLKMTNFSGQGDNVLTEVDRKEILSFFRSKDSKNPYPNLGPMRKILLHKGYEFNEQGQKVKRIKIWMKLNYATREWFLAKTSKKSSSSSSSKS